MSEDEFTKLPSAKRKKKRKIYTRSVLKKELAQLDKAKQQEKDLVAKKELSAKKKKLNTISKAFEKGQGIIPLETFTDPDVPQAVKSDLRAQKVLFEPLVNPVNGRSVQSEFLAAGEDEVLFSGGRGSGKSQALIVALLRPEYITNRNYRALVIRPTMNELRNLITKAKQIIFDSVPGAKWKTQEKLFQFPSGATIEFGYCEGEDDVERYRGQEYTILAVDELTMLPKEAMFIALASSVRTTDPTLQTQVLATTNPYGVGFAWVKKRFINLGPEATTIVVTHKDEFSGRTYHTTRRWLSSNFLDNPLIKDSYIASMASLPEEQRKRWMEGTWDGGDGMAFPEFSREKHVVKPFKVPGNWPRFRACDWGYTTMACCLWFTVDPEGVLYVYRELKTSLVTADKFAHRIRDLETGEKIRYGVIDGSVGDKRGSSAPSIDEEMRKAGVIWRYADKSAGSRLSGKNLAHQLLSVDENLGKPKLQIFDNCHELIEELGALPSDKNNPDDVDTDAPDHAWDALRFGILSRPRHTSIWDRNNRPSAPQPINSFFGY